MELGEAAMNCKVTAEFNGQRLKVLMRKKAGYSSRSSISSAASSASSHTTISSNGSSSSAAFNHISNPQHRNSDQLNCDPAFGGITATSSSSRDSSFSNSSLVVSSGSYSPHLYFGGTDPATFYSSSPTMFGDTMHSKGLN